ncbi:MAG TPA: deoxyribonuclease V [Chloroflexota bacterium]|jgi:deoxyribonuclease V|nr:deoxyribonuclease V [Chloroflexota bacterium]
MMPGDALPVRGERPAFDRSAALALQRQLAQGVERETRLGRVTTIAGVDCSAPRFGQLIRAAIVVLSWPELTLIEQQRAEVVTPLPYIPGLLSFRELPAIEAAWQQLATLPHLLMVDGQGIAHPRRLGIAAHLGVMLDLPAIGVAKSILTGHPRDGVPGSEPGDRCDLWDRDERIATLLRTRRGANPLVISTGHRVGLDDAVEWVLHCSRGYRLPEPTRQAHLLAGR